MTDAMALHSMIEGLFIRGLKVDQTLKNKIKVAGCDLDRPEPKYPIDVWERCVDLAIAELMPGVSREQGWVRMGHAFTHGFWETLVGKLVAVSVPLMSPKTLINRMPRLFSTGLENVKAHVTWHTNQRATLHIEGPGFVSAPFMQGILEVCFEKMKVAPVSFTLRKLGESTGEIDVIVP